MPKSDVTKIQFTSTIHHNTYFYEATSVSD